MIDDPLAEIGIRLLATINATFAPIRFNTTTKDAQAAICERQRSYRRGHGVPYTGGGNAAARQAHIREFAVLVDAGLAKRTGSGRGAGASLTPYGEIWLRALVGCYRVASAWQLLELVELMSGGKGNVHELDLLGICYDELQSSDLGFLELMAEPFLVAGLLNAAGDIPGSVRYALTDTGRAALADGLPEEPDDLPDLVDDAADLYDRHYIEACKARNAWIPDRPTLVIPVPATSSFVDVHPVSDQAKTLQRDLFGERAARWTHTEHFAPGGAGYHESIEYQRLVLNGDTPSDAN